MTWVFSKRCKDALKNKMIIVSIPLPVRHRLLYMLNNFNEVWPDTTDTGWNYNNSHINVLEKKIKSELGIKEFSVYSETEQGTILSSSEIDDFVLRGTYPPHLLDALELFYEIIDVGNRNSYQQGLNQIMDESNLVWRMLDGKIFPVNSGYIEEHISKRAFELLHELKFEGALYEFEKARTALVNGDNPGAISNANLAVESTIKGILRIDCAKPGELYRRLIDSGIVPEYYDGFLKIFEKDILRSVATARNQELGAGHGQGAEVNKIPPALAELAINLSGVLIKFLIERHLEQANQKQTQANEEDVPF